MKIAVFSLQQYELPFFKKLGEEHGMTFDYYSTHLDGSTLSLAKDYPIICCFVNDSLNENVLQQLAQNGTRFIALRSAGFNHVDLVAAKRLGLIVARVPAYSPHAIAEHTLGLILTLNRKIHRAYNRVRENDYSLHGLMGFDIHGSTVGIIGTGRIGSRFAKIMTGFDCELLAYDIEPNPECEEMGVNYVDLKVLLSQSDIISLHCPLNDKTYHLIDGDAFAHMKQGVMLINTSRGAIVDTKAAIEALKTGQLGYLGLDVYEEEGDLFFEDFSDVVIQDDVISRLHTFPNVVITGHQAFFTFQAVHNIVETTIHNINGFISGSDDYHEVSADEVLSKS